MLLIQTVSVQNETRTRIQTSPVRLLLLNSLKNHNNINEVRICTIWKHRARPLFQHQCRKCLKVPKSDIINVKYVIILLLRLLSLMSVMARRISNSLRIWTLLSRAATGCDWASTWCKT